MANQIIVTSNNTVQVSVTPTPTVQANISRAAINAVTNVPNANYANFANFASFSNVVTQPNQPNITSVGTLGNLNVSNNATIGNLTVTGNVQIGNLVANSANYANFAGEAFNVNVANVNGIGNVALLNLDGNASNVLHGNGVFAPEGTTGNANYANFAGNAFSVDGANVVGAVANANYADNAGNANIANTAYSVAVGNVVGIGNIATINLDGNVSNILHGDGSFGPEAGNLNANYANFAGNVVNAVQSNITALGTLSSLTVANSGNGNILADNIRIQNNGGLQTTFDNGGNFPFDVMWRSNTYAGPGDMTAQWQPLRSGGNASSPANVSQGDTVIKFQPVVNTGTTTPFGPYPGVAYGAQLRTINDFNPGVDPNPIGYAYAYGHFDFETPARISGNDHVITTSLKANGITSTGFSPSNGFAPSNTSFDITLSKGTGNYPLDPNALTKTASFTSDGNLTVNNYVIANKFSGDGGLLSNITAGNITGFVSKIANGTSNIDIATANGAIVISPNGQANTMRFETGGFANMLPASTVNHALRLNTIARAGNAAQSSGLSWFKSRGTQASPLSVQPGDVLSQIGSFGHNGTAYQGNSFAYIRGTVDNSYVANAANIPIGFQFLVNDTNGGVNNQTKTHNFYANGTTSFAGTGTFAGNLNINGALYSTISNNSQGLYQTVYNNANSQTAQWTSHRHRGTSVTPLPVQAGDEVSKFSSAVYADSGNTYQLVGETSSLVNNNDGAGNVDITMRTRTYGTNSYIQLYSPQTQFTNDGNANAIIYGNGSATFNTATANAYLAITSGNLSFPNNISYRTQQTPGQTLQTVTYNGTFANKANVNPGDATLYLQGTALTGATSGGGPESGVAYNGEFILRNKFNPGVDPNPLYFNYAAAQWELNSYSKNGNNDIGRQITFDNDVVTFGGFDITNFFGPAQSNPTLRALKSNGSTTDMVFSNDGNLTISNTFVGNGFSGNVVSANYLYGDGSNITNLTAAGSNTQIQFNNNNTFGASANLIFDNSINQFKVGTNTGSGAGEVKTNRVTITGAQSGGAFNTVIDNLNFCPDIGLTRYDNGANGQFAVITQSVYRANGTQASPTNVAPGDKIYNLYTSVYSGPSNPLTTTGGYEIVVNTNDGNGYVTTNASFYGGSNNDTFSLGYQNINLQGVVSATGNLTVPNANLGNLATANYFSGDGSLLTNVTAANITGTVANANYADYAGNVVIAAQPNITSLGNLTSLQINNTAANARSPQINITPAGNSVGPIATSNGIISITSYGDQSSNTNPFAINFIKARGNATAPTGASNGDTAMRQSAFVYNGNTYPRVGSMTFVANQAANSSFTGSNAAWTPGTFIITTGNPNGNVTSNTASSSQNIFIIDQTGSLSITPGSYGAVTPIQLLYYGQNTDGSGGSGAFRVLRARGNRDGNLAVGNGDIVGGFAALPYNGNGFRESASLYAYANTSYGPIANGTSVPSDIIITTSGNANATSSFKFFGDGSVSFPGSFTTVGQLTSGNAGLGNLATANYFQGDGSLLTNINSQAIVPNYLDAQYTSTIGTITANTIYGIPLTSVNATNITIATGNIAIDNATSTGPTRITFAKTGRYNLQFSIQLENTDNAADHLFDIWLRKNGSDIADTNTQYTVVKNNGKNVAALNLLLNPTVVNDYYELVYAVSDAAVGIKTIAAQSTPFVRPQTPGIIVTVVPVGA